ncbi:MAG: hypothetical protein F4Z35_02335 [Dehalococcoidia bacterium]|nr:hypothetical protein [Dehalococcoidia bacterium]
MRSLYKNLALLDLVGVSVIITVGIVTWPGTDVHATYAEVINVTTSPIGIDTPERLKDACRVSSCLLPGPDGREL